MKITSEQVYEALLATWQDIGLLGAAKLLAVGNDVRARLPWDGASAKAKAACATFAANLTKATDKP